MGTFTLDTTGEVRLPLGSSGGETETALYRWHNLDPFTQGYVEALLASPFAGKDRANCPYDSRACYVGPTPDDMHHRCGTVQCGRESLRFSDLAPEALAMILRDCELSHSFWCMPRDAEAGREFWALRQREPASSTFPPLTPYLGDDGRVYLREAA